MRKSERTGRVRTMTQFGGGKKHQRRRSMNALVALATTVSITVVTARLAGASDAQTLADAELAAAGGRVTADRPDALKGYQVHIVYALPSDGADRFLDTNGTLATSVLAWQKWLRGQMGTATLRVDSYRPTANAALQPDITFARLSRTDAQIASTGAFVRDIIAQELRSSGLINANDSARKIYAVYYDGSSTFSCGGSAWPPTLVGKVAALYLQGTPPGAPACNTKAFAPNPRSPGYLEFAMLHDILHALGFVPTCAPGQWRTGHVPEPNDLMYGGDAPWSLPPVLDIGHNDYYKANIPGCPELSRSAYLKPTPARAQPPPGG